MYRKTWIIIIYNLGLHFTYSWNKQDVPLYIYIYIYISALFRRNYITISQTSYVKRVPHSSTLLRWYWSISMVASLPVKESKNHELNRHEFTTTKLNKSANSVQIFGTYSGYHHVLTCHNGPIYEDFNGRDKELHRTTSVGCNYLSLPLIPASGIQVLI